MNMISSLYFLFLAYAIPTICGVAYLPKENILLNCGGSGQITDSFGREWIPDNESNHVTGRGESLTSRVHLNSSVPSVPFSSARIFQSEYTYTFSLTPGHKFVRFYFYSSQFFAVNVSDDRFSILSGPFTFLNDFSVTESQANDFIYKEYSTNVPSGVLTVTFIPAANAYAFVNGIEVVSHPDLYKIIAGNFRSVGNAQPLTDNITALETISRLNVGGNVIPPTSDTGLYRSWFADSSYLYGQVRGVVVTANASMDITYPSGMPTYMAPVDVYKSGRLMGRQTNLNSKMIWSFNVDSGFSYFFRLHFCELLDNVTDSRERKFTILLGNLTAESGAVVLGWAKGKIGGAVYKDYVLEVAHGSSPQQVIWLALAPDSRSQTLYYDIMLNGVELFKMSDAFRSLAGQSRSPPQHKPPKSMNAIIIGVIGGILALFAMMIIYTYCRYGPRRILSNAEPPVLELQPVIHHGD